MRVVPPAIRTALLRIVLIIDYIAGMIVCVCNRLTEKDVREAAQCGARTPEAAYASHDCEMQCGCCLDYAQEIIDEVKGKRPHLRVIAA